MTNTANDTANNTATSPPIEHRGPLSPVLGRTSAGCSLLGLLLIALSVGACTLPSGDTSSAEALHYAVVAARQNGDAATIWSLLHPDTRKLFDEWVAAEKEIAEIVPAKFPQKVRQSATSVLTVHTYKDGKALFSTLLTDEKSGPLTTWTQLGARVQSVELAGDLATVKTWGGDALVARKSDGKWYALLPSALTAEVERAHAQASANRRRIRDLAARLSR